MLSRIRFRENSHVIPTRSSHLKEWAWGMAGTAAVIITLGYASHLDERSDASVVQAATAERARIAMQPMVMQAYEAGLADGVAAVKDTPQGVPFVQACLAMRGGL